MVLADRPARSLGRSFVVAALLWFVVMALLAFQIFLTFGVDWRSVPEAFRTNSSSIAGFVAILAMSSVGALVAWRRPANRIGWLLLAIAITASFLDFPKLYAGAATYVQQQLERRAPGDDAVAACNVDRRYLRNTRPAAAGWRDALRHTLLHGQAPGD